MTTSPTLTSAATTRTTDEWADVALNIMLKVEAAVSSAHSVGSALKELAWLALQATAADRCAILVRDEENPSQLRPAAGASRTGDLSVLWRRFRTMSPLDIAIDLSGAALSASDGATAIEDAAGSNLLPPAWKRAWRSGSIAYAPLRAGGELFGVLAVDYVELHRFQAGEVRLLEAIAGASGVAFRGARLVDQLQRAVAIERRLSECLTALRSGHSLAEMLDIVADRFVSLLPDTSCAINLLNADGTGFRPVAHRGLAPRTSEILINELPDDEVTQIRRTWAANPRKPILVDDVRERAGWEPFVPVEIRSGMVVPLLQGSEIQGFVAVGRGAKPFTEDEVRVAMAFADQAALALEQARLTEALRLRLRIIEALYRLSDAVVRTSDLRSIVSVLNRAIGKEVGVSCTRLCFSAPELAEQLRVPRADAAERAQIRAWRHGDAAPVTAGTDVMVPVLMQNRPVGILSARAVVVDENRLELIRAMAAGIGEVAYKVKLRRTAERRSQELAVAADRERIARDLHDTVGQSLYGIGLKLQDLLCEVTDEGTAKQLGTLRALAAQGVADVRSAVYALSFLNVRERGFVQSLQALTNQFRITTGIDARLRLLGDIPRLPDAVEKAIYRVAHEALVNVERHARATGVVLSLSARGDIIELSIRDDGVGLSQRQVRDWQSSAHFGMRTMAQSIREIGGTFAVFGAQPRGLVVQVRVPRAPSRSSR